MGLFNLPDIGVDDSNMMLEVSTSMIPAILLVTFIISLEIINKLSGSMPVFI
jgi:hypothetical protein